MISCERMTVSVEDLTEELFRNHPVWEFIPEDECGDTGLRPVESSPVSCTEGRLFGGKFRLADGSEVLGYLGNFSSTDKDHNAHFLTLSIFVDGTVKHLSRYHDFDFVERGPSWLAQKLGKKEEEVFPISYDFSDVATGREECLRGSIPREPEIKLSKNELIRLAVWRDHLELV
jgi:hypothetical protein